MELTTRFDQLDRRFARGLLALLGLLLLAAIFTPEFTPPKDAPEARPSITDPQLYRQINKRVAAGEPYYEVAAQEQRANGYPVKPAVTVRLPTMSLLFAVLGSKGAQTAMLMLCAATTLLWYRRIKSATSIISAAIAASIIALSSVFLAREELSLFHEGWAALLAALSLATWSEERPWLAIIIAFLAACFREFAAPLLAMMAVLAILQKRRGEAAGWLAMLALWGLVFLLHAQAVALVVLPNDLTSPGWQGLGGWPLLVGAAQQSILLLSIPTQFAAPLFILALFGWASWRDSRALRALGWLLGMALMIMLFARPNNFYWVLMMVPLLLAGLAFVPVGLIALWRSAQKSTHSL